MSTVQRIWKVDGKKPLNPAHIAPTAKEHGWPMQWWGKVNSIACPRGRQWGEAHFIVSQETFDSLSFDAAIDITCEHEDGTTTWQGYYCIKTEAITPGKDDPTHWLVLADRRWIMSRSTANVRYNLRKSETTWVDSTTNAGTPHTWQEILEDLWTLLPGVAGTCPTLPTTPSSTPENFVFDGMVAWRCINQVLAMIGCAAVHNPFDGTFDFVELSATQSGLATLKSDNEDRRLWQYSPQELPASNYPAEVEVTYHYLPGGTNDDSPFPKKPETDTSSLGQSGIAGTSYPIVDTLFAYDDNSAARTARTTEIKNALVGLLKPMARPWGMVYSGILEFQVGEEITDIIWTSDGARGMRTIAKFIFSDFEWVELITEGAGGGGGIIGYEIVSISTAGTSSPYNGLVIASVTIVTAPCDRGDIVGDTVDVVDHSGCIFDQSQADLVDVFGWAEEAIAKDLSVGAGANDLSPCHWSAINRCCTAAGN